MVEEGEDPDPTVVPGPALAYRHTAAVIGGTDGKIIALDVTTLAWTADSEESVTVEAADDAKMFVKFPAPFSPVV